MFYDYLIIGAGPAALQLGYFLGKGGYHYQILEADKGVGAFFRKHPRHRKLISINKVVTGFDDREMNLRWDWNSLINDDLDFTKYTSAYFPPADSLVQYLEDFATHYNLNVRTSYPVKTVRRDGDQLFHVSNDQGETLTCKHLIVATGLSKPHTPDFPGVELCEQYADVSIDPEDFRGQRVLILGKGNSALETADNLIETTASVHLCSPTPAKLAWNTHFVGHIRAVNNNFLDTYQLKSQNVVLDAWVEKLERAEDGGLVCRILYTHAKGETRVIHFDRAILATGWNFDTSIFDDSCKPELCLNGKLPNMTEAWESVNIPDLYFAGVITQMRDFKKTMSGFIHGFRHNTEALYHILCEKYQGKPWRGEVAQRSCREVAEWMIDRLNRSPSMFLQPGFFADVVVDHGDGNFELLVDVPREFAATWDRLSDTTYYTLSLEYGDYSKVVDAFAIDRDPDPANAHLIEYLHPIIRKFEAQEKVCEHHLVEDLENIYSDERYVRSICEFLERQTSAVSA